jgi:hypothetical protein
MKHKKDQEFISMKSVICQLVEKLGTTTCFVIFSLSSR